MNTSIPTGEERCRVPHNRAHFYDRHGVEITPQLHAELLADDKYRILASAQVGSLAVVTHWTGLDMDMMGVVHAAQRRFAMIFETVVLPAEPRDTPAAVWGVHLQRYPSEPLALEGHVAAIDWAHEYLEREAEAAGGQARVDTAAE